MKGSSNNPKRSFVNSHKSCRLYRKKVSESLHFKTFCEEIGAEYVMLFYHTEVCWLSGGQVLKHLFELRADV
jgi:hypothetical protein